MIFSSKGRGIITGVGKSALQNWKIADTPAENNETRIVYPTLELYQVILRQRL
jgi:D-arabinose 5-phosphate isomerase GutQ